MSRPAWDPPSDLPALPAPRADEPRPPQAHTGFFGFASTQLSGLPVEFWTLQLYLFFQLSLLDEHLATLEQVRPRFFLGAFTLLVALARVAFAFARTGEAPRRPAAPTTWLLAFVAASGFSVLTAFEFDLARNAFQDHATVLVGYLLIVAIVHTRRELLLTVLTLCLGGGVYLVLSYREWLGGRYDFAQGVVRMIGLGRTNADANSFGATITFLLPVIVWAGVTTRLWLVRLCAVAYGALCTVCVFLTSSRSALVLLALNLLFALALLPGRVPRLVGAVVVAGVVAFMAGGLSEEQGKRIASIFSSETYESEQSTLGRIEGYHVAFRIFQEEPLLGVGPGNWAAYRTRKIDGNPLEPHNLLGQLIATRGAAGLLTFAGYLAASVLFCVRVVRTRRRSLDPWDGALVRLAFTGMFVLLLLLVSGLGAHNLERPNWVWMPALVVAAASVRRESVLDALPAEPVEAFR